MKKFNVRIQRVEYYNVDIEVEAESVAAAIESVRKREEANEFAGMFDCPDDVETQVYCPNN